MFRRGRSKTGRRTQWGRDKRSLPTSPVVPRVSDARVAVGRVLVLRRRDGEGSARLPTPEGGHEFSLAASAGMLAGARAVEILDRHQQVSGGRWGVDGKAAAYVCQNFACQAPVTDVEELRALLAR